MTTHSPARPRSAFVPAPEVAFRVYVAALDQRTCDDLRTVVLTRERELIGALSPTPVAGMEVGLTTLWRHYNVLAWEDAPCHTLALAISAAVREYGHYFGARDLPCFIQCWANVLRRGDSLSLHSHSQEEGAVSGLVYIDGGDAAPDSGCTRYALPSGRWMTIAPQAGAINLFPSSLPHDVLTYDGEAPRVTVAFDLMHSPSPEHSCLRLSDIVP